MRLIASLLFLPLLNGVHAGPGPDFSRDGGNRFDFIAYSGGYRWPSGPIKWYYNPAGQPSGFSTDQVVATLQKAAAKWSNGCNVRLQYMGTNSTATAGNNDGVSVIAWQGPLSVNSTFGGFTRTYALVRNTSPLLGEGDIWLNPARVNGLEELEGLATHEMGHMLGLAHSNNPNSIMFSQPYHPSAGFDLALRGDDATGCARLYGSTGVAPTPSTYADSALQLSAGQKVNLYVVAYDATLSYTPQPTAIALASTPADGSGVKFVSYFNGMKVGDTLGFDVIMPDNTLYYHYGTTSAYTDAYYYTYLGDSTKGMQYFPGNWRFAFTINGVKKAERNFSVPATSAVPGVPDIALVGTPLGGGSFSFRAVNLTPARSILSNQWGFDDAALFGDTVTAALGSGATHTARLFTISSNPRSGADNPGSAQGDGPDNTRTATFAVSASGGFDQASFAATVSGIRPALSLEGQVTLPTQDAGQKNIYVAVLVGSTFYFHTASGWGTTPDPLMQVSAPAVAAFSIFDGFDTSMLPAGTAVYIGYGASVDQVIQQGKYAQVYVF